MWPTALNVYHESVYVKTTKPLAKWRSFLSTNCGLCFRRPLNKKPMVFFCSFFTQSASHIFQFGATSSDSIFRGQISDSIVSFAFATQIHSTFCLYSVSTIQKHMATIDIRSGFFDHLICGSNFSSLYAHAQIRCKI
jgi:hypothetical protein